MVEYIRARLAVVSVVLLVSLISMMPNWVDFKDSWWPSEKKLSYGLDIQGGLHLVLGIDVQSALGAHLKKTGQSISETLKTDHQITLKSVEVVDPSIAKIRLMLGSPADKAKVDEYMRDSRLGQGHAFQVMQATDEFVEAKYYEPYMRRFKKNLVDRTIETIRNRIDELGVKEPTIAAQSGQRILVQLPGLEDSAQAKEIINKTALLEFMIVDPEYHPYQKPEKVAELAQWISEAETNGKFALGQEGIKFSAYVKKVNEALKDKLPKDRVIRFAKAEGAKTLEDGKIPYLLQTDALMTGETLNDAGVSVGQMGNPIVTFSFNPKGAKEFGDLTTTHQKKLMAIVLDNVVQTAPRLKNPITGGSGYIEMGSGDRQQVMDEANLIAMVLRSGSLPAELEQLEERTVGPTLGQDSIDKGKVAGLLGGLLVFIFMLVYYKFYGIVADLALAFNILMILAVLTSLQATLTLPGVAGIALTIGMAVDANVIIYERIKEELAKGAGLAAAIKEGYARAFWAIFDANVTTAAVCIVLMYFGTGPIRGFAITLICGIATSMFTAIFFTRTILNLLVGKFKMKFSF